MEEIFSRVPLGSKLVLMTDHIGVRDTNGEVKDWPWSANYHAAITAIAAPYPFVLVQSFQDHVRNEEKLMLVAITTIGWSIFGWPKRSSKT